MSYRDFTVGKLKQQFDLKFIEQAKPIIEPLSLTPSLYIQETIERNFRIAQAVSTEKIRSELIIAPVLMELVVLLNHQVSLFSGSDFTVDASAGLNGWVDFLISNSPEQLEIEAPVAVIVEAKKEELNTGISQCVATMVAAVQFNQAREKAIAPLYGTVTTGTFWRFLMLQNDIVTIDFTDYGITSLEVILGTLMSMLNPSKPS
ncbi:MAG: hypothetical protein HC873_17410 [Leptolyngbyaceae cyanobacterium SL_1_1]|nr:hypothetical protein [Leptolyngbyaceae cyanobacterium RM1_1_2]NJO11122.1 hypothetical protein [Leptolyngbyaceae cyanobacterium SL_1_1]